MNIRSFLRGLAADPPQHGCTIGGQPAMPVLISEYNDLVARAAAAEAAVARVRRTVATRSFMAGPNAVDAVYVTEIHTALGPPAPTANQATDGPELSDPTQCPGDEGFCPEHGYHRHSLKQPGEQLARTTVTNPVTPFADRPFRSHRQPKDQ